jgi:hypothetical protein
VGASALCLLSQGEHQAVLSQGIFGNLKFLLGENNRARGALDFGKPSRGAP